MTRDIFSAGRRRFVAGLPALPLICLSEAYAAPSAGQRPVWTGFGLNGGVGEDRFSFTKAYVKNTYKMDLLNTEAFKWMRVPLNNALKSMKPEVVEFRDSIEFGEKYLLGFAHDYELVVGQTASIGADRKDNADTLFFFMSGVGLVLGFDSSSSWRIVSSFPFLLRHEEPWVRAKSSVRDQAVKQLGDVYQQYVKAFTHYLGGFSKWNRSYSSNYFARVTKADFHPEAKEKLKQLKVDHLFGRELVGYSASALICDLLDIPLLPFQENDALAKRYAVKFSNNLQAQDSKIQIPDADVLFEIIIRDIEKQVIPSKQMGVTTIRRQVVVNFRVKNSFDGEGAKPFFQTFAAANHDDDRIPHGSTEDDTPERDVVFFDRLLTRTLTFLLKGIVKKDPEELKKANVKFDVIATSLPRLLELCAKTRG